MGSTHATNTTHLLWADRWIEVCSSANGWTFKNGTDASTWLLYPLGSDTPIAGSYPPSAGS